MLFSADPAARPASILNHESVGEAPIQGHSARVAPLEFALPALAASARKHMHVLVVAGGDIVTDAFKYRLQQPAVA